MKKASAFVCVYLWLIVFCLSISAQDFQKVRDGIEYAKITKQMKSADGKDENVVFNLLRLNLTKVRLDVFHAKDAAIGLEKTSSIATRHGAIAAINGGFFRIDKSIFEGDAVSTLMINKKLLSESKDNDSSNFGRINLMISNKPKQTYIFMERIKIKNMVTTKGKAFFVGTNRQRKENDFLIFSRLFSNTTLTDDSGIEFIVQNNRVIQIFNGKGNNKIPVNGYVLSVSGDFRDEALKFLKVGTKVQVSNAVATSTAILPQMRSVLKVFSQTEDITNGIPQLIRNGKIDITWQEEKTDKKFVETHHPRTAVAKLKDGKFLMVTVDGRSEASGGISLPDLAAFLLEMGATDAMNLDGGGSSTMFLDGKVVNHPSDSTGERAVGDAILVFPRK